MRRTKMTFEESLTALEAIAKKLESGECSLEESIKLYARCR
ncbi:MAG: exodeoxyribonuclease VII small subunit [Clostridia bacterium]|nr:exodeoxyribonuclease VII small subunit [Clostridia bacterium]